MRTRFIYVVGTPCGGWRRTAAVAGVVVAVGLGVNAATLVPLDFTQSATTYNLQSQRGVPLSSVSNSPAGSDGRAPSISEVNESGTQNLATPNQYQGVVTFGGVAARTDWLSVSNAPTLRGTNAFSAAVAADMQLPRAYNGANLVMVLRRAQVGSPYLARKVDFAFGSEISMPSTDENGLLLTNVLKEAYWRAEPFTTNDHANAGYYWSKHAQKVFLVQAGPLQITWRKLSPYLASTAPTNYTNPFGSRSFETNGSSVYLLYTVNYVGSGGAIKTPKQMYWTEKTFIGLGRPVTVPAGRVGAVNIIYNNNFPRSVDEEYKGLGDSSITDGNTNLQSLAELRTLWYDQTQGSIHAYNQTGRVFVEFLGDITGSDGQTRQHLGFEIVDVEKQPTPLDVTAELGEPLSHPLTDAGDALYPEEVMRDGSSFLHTHPVVGSDEFELYAAKKTLNLNDCQVRWLEEGVAGLRWVHQLARYKLDWPADIARYSHYIRPLVATEKQAQETAITLPRENMPAIAYQDPLDQPRAKLTDQQKFYTFLTPAYPAHRALLQYTSGDNVAFERVFSWLDANLSATNFAGSVAQELTAVTNYPLDYVAYTNYPDRYNAYTNKYNAYTNYVASNTDYVAKQAAYDAYRTNYVGYTNQMAQYVAYTNYQAQYVAYTNYLALRSRGVNGAWSLYVQDDTALNGGSIAGWSLLVDVQNPLNGATNTVTNTVSGAISLSPVGVTNGVPYPKTVTVSGLTNAVLGVRVAFSNFAHSAVADLDILLAGPRANVTYVMSDVGSGSLTNASLTFSDAAALALSNSVAFSAGGTYRPSNYDTTETVPNGLLGSIVTNLNALLLSAPTPISDPGAAPAAVAYPGNAPAVVANPGSAPQVVADPGAVPVCPDEPVFWGTTLFAPRLVNQTVVVGDRIAVPAGELGADGYFAGHINAAKGNLYHAAAYLDPISNGFANANAGAIIPVNAVPGANALEVWWFRASAGASGANAGNSESGFQTVYWPSVLAHYTIEWPKNPREIVLASKLGSGTLDEFESLGSIYRQNDRSLPGYNPNEEHAIMYGGTAYATRDDLNKTNAVGYSSHPFVLVSYTAQDGRPAVSVFKVLREKPEAGYVFDYISTAGVMLQGPMPLELLQPPVEGSGDKAVTYNAEIAHTGGDLPVGWNSTVAKDALYTNYPGFTYTDRNKGIWVYRGPHAGLPVLKVGTYVATNRTFCAFTNATAIVGSDFACTLHASRQDEYLSLTTTNNPAWLTVNGLTLSGRPTSNDVGTATLTLVAEDQYDHSRATNVLALTVLLSGTPVTQAGLALASTNSYTGTALVFSNRPPFLAVSPTPTNSFTMRFYYKTEAGFDFPGLATPPATGSIVPYLRPLTNGTYLGTGAAKTDPALEIVYRPVWPERNPTGNALPTMQFGYTLTKEDGGLAGVRDMKTARVLYQQSVALCITNPPASVVLHDATRAKYSSLTNSGLTEVPASVAKSYYQGKYYFPNLPPHLAKRLFFDPTRNATAKGSLVLQGEFVNATLGKSYTLLNVLRDSDLAAVKGLCPAADTVNKAKWDALVDSLATDLETFHENPEVPGTYVPDESLTRSVGAGSLAEITSDNTAVDSYALSATGPGSGYVTLVDAGGDVKTKPGESVSLHIIRVDGSQMYPGEVIPIASDNPLSEQVTFQHTCDLAGRSGEFEYEWKIAAPVDGDAPKDVSVDRSQYLSLASGTDMPRRIIGGAGIQALGDNYVIMRYRANNPKHPLYHQWSEWTAPTEAEGWIKRVLKGINPFNQRMGDLFNNKADTSVSMLTQAGTRWEGDVALNQDTLNAHGLIEIYETVLRRGRALSIESGYNYGPANDALLLAAGYLNDLYMMIGGEAWADASNPTIGIGTKDLTYGDIATSLFAFKGQVSSLLDEELTLLRGRDDFLLPGVKVSPVYNRLVWNYTRGIDAGEVIYALNYNIQENPDREPDGVINAEDAAIMYPQGHGDAYGHYLTALKGYYSLLLNSCFDWVPRIESVNVLGTPVAVDYQDERKFAAAAVAVARTGRQVFDLVFRKDYQQVSKVGWEHFGSSRTNATTGTERFWGMDHWASRTGQGAYLNWVVGNALLPSEDPIPSHEGIQKIDRTTVPELQELGSQISGIQTAMDNAEGGLNPLGMPEGGLAFDINPNAVVGADNGTHFEQIYSRAKTALNNAVASFNDAKDVTKLMRSEQDTLADFQSSVSKQELAYNNALIELYGTPYADDIGPGKTWKQGYTGPDLIHYAYVNIPESTFGGALELNPSATYRIDTQQLKSDWVTKVCAWNDSTYKSMNWVCSTQYIDFVWDSHGFFAKPTSWTGSRQSPGKIQQAISDVIKAHDRVSQALATAQAAKDGLTDAITIFDAGQRTQATIDGLNNSIAAISEAVDLANAINAFYEKSTETAKAKTKQVNDVIKSGIPSFVVAGMAVGTDTKFAADMAIEQAKTIALTAIDGWDLFRFGAFQVATLAQNSEARWAGVNVAALQRDQATQAALIGLGSQVAALSDNLTTINQRLREADDAMARYQSLVAEGDRILEERLVYRQRAATVIQGYRTRDAAFRLFRNEKLERYKTLFDLAARYAFLAANAYDYETGLLGTSAGRNFIGRIVSSRALGVVSGGEPQYAGSDTGDPGLSSALAEMKSDWDVLRGRLGFNNPDAYGTTVSLRTEAMRILPTSDGDANWKDELKKAWKENVLEDSDVRRFCMQIDSGNGLPVPGIVLTFSTTIADGYNLFGQELAAGDHAFSPSSFATKIFGVGTAFIGYRGMDNPAANSGVGGTTPSEPDSSYLDPQALSATPYIYLIPVGLDSMRSPPLGDVSTIRTWSVNDLAIPMPFNIGESDFSTKALWQSSDSLTEPLYTVRKHQAFRPVSTTSVFSSGLYGANGTLVRSQFTNNRLVGRSVWNSQWKLVIPGKTLLNNPTEGLNRFVDTVTDVKLHFVTYSYSGN